MSVDVIQDTHLMLMAKPVKVSICIIKKLISRMAQR